MTGSGMRIAVLCGSIKPLFSGTDDYNEALSDALRQRGVDVGQVDIGRWDLSQAGKLLRTVAAARPDAILMQYPTDAFGRSFTPHVFALLQRIAPLVVTLHEFTAGHVLRRLSVGPLLARASGVVVTAQREADSLSRWYPWLRRRVRIIHIGPNVPRRQWTPVNPPRVVYFGQIRPEKGLEAFIACRDRLAANRPRTEFRVIGSPVPQFAAFFDKITADARARDMTLLTGLDRDSVADELAAATVTLLPYPDGASFRRGTLLAAAVCGVPIVTRTGRDTPGDLAPLLATAATVDEMTALVETYLADPAALQAAHARSRRLGEMVDWAAIANEYITMFSSVLAVRKPSLAARRA